MLKGKKLSILGDSVSTYRGVSDDGAACAAIACNPYRYKEPFPIERTYWGRLMEKFEWELCVNNSWSGGNLSGVSDPSAGVNRARFLSRDDGTEPDIVIVFMGINDLGRGVDATVFGKDYSLTLSRIKEDHPAALVVSVNMPDRDIFLKKRAEAFNAEIEKATEAAGENFVLADLFHSRLKGDFYYMNTVDGLHPDEDGMRYIAEVIEEAILRKIK